LRKLQCFLPIPDFIPFVLRKLDPAKSASPGFFPVCGVENYAAAPPSVLEHISI
jgi:hypothetical protein